MRLRKPVNELANQKVRVELSSKSAKFTARTTIHDGLNNPQSTTKSRDDPANGRYFHVPRRVTNQVHVAARQSLPHRRPASVNGDSRSLVSQRSQVSLLEESLECNLR